MAENETSAKLGYEATAAALVLLNCTSSIVNLCSNGATVSAQTCVVPL